MNRSWFRNRIFLPDDIAKQGAEGVVASVEKMIEAEMRDEAANQGFTLIGDPIHEIYDLSDPRTCKRLFGDHLCLEFSPSERWVIETKWLIDNSSLER